MKKIKLLHITDTLNLGGAERVVIQLARGVDPSRFEAAVVTFLPGALDAELADSGVRLLRLPAAPRLARFAQLARVFTRERPDIVHTHMFSAGFWGRLTTAFFPRTKVVHSHHSLTFRHRPWKRILPEWGLTLLSDRVVCVSSAVRDHLCQTWRLPQRRMIVIPNGVSMARYRANRQGVHSPPRLLALGRLEPVKGYDVLLQALHELAGLQIPFTCDIVGDGSQRAALEALSARLGLSSRVRFCGRSDSVPAVLVEADVLVAPSHREGLSLAILEAMASGLPVVATRVGGNIELLEGVGHLVAPANSRELCAALSSVLKDPSGSLETARRARERVERHYSLENMILLHEKLYEELLAPT